MPTTDGTGSEQHTEDYITLGKKIGSSAELFDKELQKARTSLKYLTTLQAVTIEGIKPMYDAMYNVVQLTYSPDYSAAREALKSLSRKENWEATLLEGLRRLCLLETECLSQRRDLTLEVRSRLGLENAEGRRLEPLKLSEQEQKELREWFQPLDPIEREFVCSYNKTRFYSILYQAVLLHDSVRDWVDEKQKPALLEACEDFVDTIHIIWQPDESKMKLLAGWLHEDTQTESTSETTPSRAHK